MKECCSNPKRYRILFDGGGTGDDEILVCDYHFTKDDTFTKFIKEIKEVDIKSDPKLENAIRDIVLQLKENNPKIYHDLLNELGLIEK